MKAKLLFVSLAALVAAASSSFAQTEPGKSYVSSDTVLVIAERIAPLPATNSAAAKFPLALRLTPASVGVVTNSLIENQNAIVLGDALNNVSGVNVQTGFGAFDYFVIRGFESLTSGLVLTDGAAEPEVTFYNLYNIERVEVLKGPGAFLYGGNPLSGAVNLVRKQPHFKNFFNASGSAGHFSSYRGTLDFGLTNAEKSVAFRANALWQDSENYRDNKDNENISINPALTWRMNGKTSVTANFEYVKSKYQPDSGLPLLNNEIPNVPRTQSYQSPFDVSDQTVLRGRLDFETRVNDSFTLRNKFYYTDLDWQSDGTLLFGAFPTQFGNFVFRSLTALDDRQKLVGNQLEGLLRFNTGNVRHQILAGVELSRLGDEFTLAVADLPALSLESPQESAAAVNPFPFLQNDARSVNLAPYLVDQIFFSEKFQTLVGGRFDVIDYKDTHAIPVQGQLFSISTTREYKKFSPMLGLIFSPTQYLSFYANGGRAFGPPSTQVIEDISAEESQQLEAGVKTQFLNGRFNTGLAVYQLDKNDLIIPDYSGLRYLSGEQRSRGFEIDVTAQPATGLQTYVAYAFNDAELTNFAEDILVPTQAGPVPQRVDRSGNTPAFAPKHILNVWATKAIKSNLGFGVGGRYVSPQFIDEDNAFEIDDYFTLDAMIYYRLGNWSWSLNAKNLTDTKYETRGYGSGSVLPGNPFAIFCAAGFQL